MCVHSRTDGWQRRIDCCGSYGAARHFSPRYSTKIEVVRELEEYQKDLEEEVIEIADWIKTLKVEA